MLIVGDSNPTQHIRFAFVNWAIILLCVGLFLADIPGVEYAFTPAEFHHALTKDLPMDATLPVYSSLITYAFFHGGFLHIAGNLLSIWVFGNNIEDSMGHWRYALFFLLCAAGGALAELTSPTPGLPIIGASGAAAGIMGAYLLLHPRAQILVLAAFRIPVLVPAGIVVGITIALNIVSAVWDNDTDPMLIAYRAHLGGFAAGMTLVPLFRHRDVPLFQSASHYPEQAFGALGRFAIRIGSDTPLSWLFWIKAAAFFLLVSIGAEILVETIGL